MTGATEAAVTVVLTTTPSAEEGERIGGAVVSEGLAACANVLSGVTSIFRWHGAVVRESEALVIIKTTAEATASLRERIVELHPYEVPEVIVLGVSGGHEPYLEWVRHAVAEAR
jgi:periplasmic divalent cation tolerance protein